MASINKSIFWVLAVLCFTAVLPIGPASAEPSSSEKLILKSTVVKHIKDHTKLDTYFFVSSATTKLMKLKFVEMHPVVFERPDGIYVLCADFENAKREKVLVDYFLQELNGKFIVLSSIEGKRSFLMGIAQKFGL